MLTRPRRMGLHLTTTIRVRLPSPIQIKSLLTHGHSTAKCMDSTIFKNIGVFNSSINIATDLLFALIPIPMVWRLQVTIQTRIGLAVILGLGLFASAIAIYKTPMQANFFKEMDWSGSGSWYYIWQQYVMISIPMALSMNKRV